MANPAQDRIALYLARVESERNRPQWASILPACTVPYETLGRNMWGPKWMASQAVVIATTPYVAL